MQFLEHNSIDQQKWDKTVLSSAYPLVYCQSFYLNATSPGWRALVEDNYSSIMPVTAAKKLGINYCVQPPFTPQLGIYGNFSKEVSDKFLSFLKEKYKYISIELNAANVISGKETKNKRTFVIRPDEEFLYNSNTKRNILKAKKSNIQIEEIPFSEIRAVSKKYLNPFLKNKLKLRAKHVKVFDDLLKSGMEQKYLKTFVAKNQAGEITALAHFISNGIHAVYLKGTGFDKNSGSMHLLMDKAIQSYRVQKVKLFDFGGGQSDSMARFFSGFGAKELSYKIYKVNNLPGPIGWLKK